MSTLEQRLDEALSRTELTGPSLEQGPSLEDRLEAKLSGGAPQAEVNVDVLPTLERGLRTTGANLLEFVGQEEMADELIAAAPQAQIANFRDIDSVENVGQFIAERTLESAPSTLLSVGGGLLGGFAIGGLPGAVIGALAATFPNLTGETMREIREEGGEGTLGEAALAGAVKSGIELAPVGAIAKALGLNKVLKNTVEDVIQESDKFDSVLDEVISRGGDIATVAGTEAVVEPLQTLTDQIAKRLATNQEVLSLSPEDREELLQAAVGGLAGGTGAGSIAAIGGATLDHTGVIDRARERMAGLAPEEVEQKKRIDAILKKLDENENILNTIAAEEEVDLPSGIGEMDAQPLGLGLTMKLKDSPTLHGPGYSYFGFNATGFADQLRQLRFPDMIVHAGKDADGNVIHKLKGDDKGVAVGKMSDVRLDDGTVIPGAELEAEILGAAQGIFKELGYDVPTIIADQSQDGFFSSPISDSTHGSYSRGELSGTAIRLNTKALARGMKDAKEFRGSVFETLTHEIGHAIVTEQWINMDKNSSTYKALIGEYRKWLRDVDSMSVQEFFQNYQGPTRQHNTIMKAAKTDRSQPMTKWLAKQGVKDTAYYLSFDEYAAMQMTRLQTHRGSKGKLKMDPEAKAFWEQMLDRLKTIYEKLKHEFRPGTAFETWVENVALRQELMDIQNDPYTGEAKAGAKESASKVTSDIKEEVAEQGQDVDQESTILGGLLSNFGLNEAAEQVNQHGSLHMKFLRIAKLLTPIQLAQLAQNHNVMGPSRYMDVVRQFANTKMKQIERADHIARKWRKFGKTKSNIISKFLFEVSTESDRLKRRLTDEELADLRPASMDDEMFSMWQEIDQSFRDILGDVERGLVLDAATSFSKRTPEEARDFRDRFLAEPGESERLAMVEEFTGEAAIDVSEDGTIIQHELYRELVKIEKQIGKLRNKNYFPRARIGQYVVKITAKREGQEWEGNTAPQKGSTLGFYAFENKKERDAFLKQIKGEVLASDLNIAGTKMDSEVFAFMGMPEALIQRIKKSETLGLNATQKALLDDISLDLSPGKKFLRNLQKRRGIAGFNEDGLRVYSNYMMSAANHLARVEHSKSLLAILSDMKAEIDNAVQNGEGQIVDDLQDLKDYYNAHFDYLMKPDNDWASLRAIGFLWYLGLNVKSALVNLTQIPMVTFPVMAQRFGDGTVVKRISQSYKQTTSWLRGNRDAFGDLSDDVNDMLERFKEAGIIDESMVMELAGLGEGDRMRRLIPGWDFNSSLSRVSYFAGSMFRMAEKYNRFVTSVAAYQAGRKDGGMDHEGAVAYARDVVEKSQFEYAKWNRPEFMRGKKSVIFLFWQYMQHASFLFYGGNGGKTAMRMWLMALLVSGIAGLPFWKTLTSFLDFSGTHAQKALGVANPKVEIEKELRELLLEITDQPDKVMRGMSSFWGLGPLHLTSLLGAPIPEVDVQGSLGFGSPIPFLDELFEPGKDPDAEFGKFVAGVLGPVGGMGYQAYKSMTSTDPNVWKRVEKAMPIFMKNAMQGSRWLAQGEETFRGEGEFLNFEHPEGRVEAVAKSLGFTPTRLSRKYQQVRAGQMATLFWTTQRQLLMEDYHYARVTKDREGLADVRRAIKAHNKTVKVNKELRGLGISGRDLSQSLRQRAKSIAKRERGLPQSKREVGLTREAQRLFPIEG